MRTVALTGPAINITGAGVRVWRGVADNLCIVRLAWCAVLRTDVFCTKPEN